MAYAVYKSGRKKFITHRQGVSLWKTLRNTDNLTDAQKVRIGRLQAIYLNYRQAPDEYIQENLERVTKLAMNDWAVDSNGNPTHPQNDADWDFARRWNLPIRKAPQIITGALPVGDR